MQQALNDALETLIQYHITKKNTDDAIQLIKLGADPNYKNNKSHANTILYVACSSFDTTPEQITTLLSLGCDPMIKNTYQETVVTRAIGMQRPEIIDVILEATKSTRTDRWDVTTQGATKTFGKYEDFGKKKLAVWKVLAKHGGKFTSTTGQSALHWYLQHNQKDALPELVSWLTTKIEEEQKEEAKTSQKQNENTKLEITRKIEESLKLLTEIYNLINPSK